ncbi:MAG TPA: thrombospondin type 3 repeat-containing protein, partial [Pseudomonadales bacterium]|nr:thrombospondin type 3 repeat-containing protein [Pseudomonadales bacterium]
MSFRKCSRMFFSFLLLVFAMGAQAFVAGNRDTSFTSGGTGEGVWTSAVQADGKIVIGGLITYYQGVSRRFIARLDANGALDTSFNPGTGFNGAVRTIAMLPNGKMLVGGNFTSYNGTAITNIARLNADGSLDTSFKCGAGTNTNGYVYSILVQPDGKALLGGGYSSYAGQSAMYVRLNIDGSIDTSFVPPATLGSVMGSALQPDGKILVAGAFSVSVAGHAQYGVLRLNPDGSVDTGFQTGSGTNTYPVRIALQADGKSILIGAFTSVNGIARKNIARLNVDGSLDTSFVLTGTGFNTGVNFELKAVAVQPGDNKVVVGGYFTAYNGVSANNLARLNSDGSLDTGFVMGSGTNGEVDALTVRPDGKILVGGAFTLYNGVTSKSAVLLHSGDTDSDNVEDAADLFPGDPTESADNDHDGIGDNADSDDDNDGFNDANDNCTWLSNADQLDVDSDGIGNVCDSDDDNDGVADDSDAFPLNKAASVDADGDGYPDGWNASCDAGCQAVSGLSRDNCLGLKSPDLTNTDGDSYGNVCDTDDDNDGVPDTSDAFPLNAAASVDNDKDGIPDVWSQPNPYGCAVGASSCNGLLLDVDLDNDGVDDSVDNCPSDPNPGQADEDHDGIGNPCDPDGPGKLDASYHGGKVESASFYTSASIGTAVSQPDGKVIIGGWFQAFSGVIKNGIARINTDGSLDSAFVGVGASDTVSSIALQPDGKIFIAGRFTQFDGVNVNRVARLNNNGSLDTTFNPGSGANDYVSSSARQPDGKILIGGNFTSYNGVAVNRIARLNADGSLDNSFNPGSGSSTPVLAIVLQNDGKILIGGNFTTYNGVTVNRIARLNADGSRDVSFNTGSGANNSVYGILLQADGKSILYGTFASINGVSRKSLARLNPDGTVDTGFDTSNGVNNSIYNATMQVDGKIIIGGYFSAYSGIARKNIARVNTDGSLDTDFSPGTGPNTSISGGMLLDPDGRLLVISTYLTSYNGMLVGSVLRIHTGDADQDAVEDAADVFPNDPTEAKDLDRDGIGDNTDTDADGDVIDDTVDNCLRLFNPDQQDTNHDGVGDACDQDVDGDGVLNAVDKFPFNAAESADKDNDGVGDNADADDDNDGVADVADNCSLLSNPDQQDADHDGSGDACDTDMDGDGVLNPVDQFPLVAGETSDSDGDGVGDNADTDDDNDGIPDVADDCRRVPDASQRDDDRDGVGNACDSDVAGAVDVSFDTHVGGNGLITASVLQPDDKLVMVGTFSTYNGISRNGIVRLNADGSVDESFNPGSGVASRDIMAIALQPDGKIMIGGSFLVYNGIGVRYVARLNPDGSLDTNFKPGIGPDGIVRAIAVQPDGKYLLGGDFIRYNTTLDSHHLVRLNADGSVDTLFSGDNGTNKNVNAIVVQSDGKIIISGNFGIYKVSTTNNGIARLNADLSIDASFKSVVGVQGVLKIVLQPDGKYLIGGNFGSYEGVARKYLARLNGDGSLDAAFNAGNGLNGSVAEILLQVDGKMIVGGAFTTYNLLSNNGVMRLNADSSLDATFDAGTGFAYVGNTPSVYTGAIQSDGRIVMVGNFNRYHSAIANNIARLHSGDWDHDGLENARDYTPYGSSDRDTAFTANVNGDVLATALQADGKILIGGAFTTVNGVSRNHIA